MNQEKTQAPPPLTDMIKGARTIVNKRGPEGAFEPLRKGMLFVVATAGLQSKANPADLLEATCDLVAALLIEYVKLEQGQGQAVVME